MTDKSFTEFQEEADHGQQWEIAFEIDDDRPSTDEDTQTFTRTTTLAWLAYRAMDDPEAEVTEL